MTNRLQGHLDAALRACAAAAENPDALKRVEVKLQRNIEGDQGWDVFALHYLVEGPLAVVLSPEAMAGEADSL